jgi:uncharacterized protein YbjT (DUF2867 family)
MGESKRIFVSGGSGFVGAAVIAELRRRHFQVSALVNRKPPPGNDPGVHTVAGGLFDATALGAAMEGCSAAVHLVGIIAERPSRGITFQHIHVDGTAAVVAAARSAGVGRFLYLSALGARPDPAASTYHRTKFAAEQAARGSPLACTILRPSLIHGPGGAFMQQEAKWARKQSLPFLAMPYFGAGWLGLGGAGRLQPVWVDDVARALVDAIDNPATSGKTYNLAGPDIFTWPQLHQAVATAVVGHRRWVLPMPVPMARFYAAIGLGKLLGFNQDQIVMSQEDNTADVGPFVQDFGWSPRRFEETLAQYASQL